ncbi:ABC transporter substrate-binding protein [Jiangella ureilytica]|uniref:ABC transporter substrate-binding protein n=1 Tax=Jiangella ureilytica TaxID=2530374 RepID=A0A4R4RS09_9ACTN|nr:ABC transporter substrate-binding protein [Jiangella ureilytica]TDC52788.1 ABC transporter substrate-binding protein [Jiangella ureilytica]
MTDLIPLRMGFPSPGGGSLPAWAAMQDGEFRSRGYEVEPVDFPGSSAVVRALHAGDVQFANIASPALLEANLTVPGSDLVYLTGALNTFSHILITAEPTDGVEALRGQRIGARVTDGQVLDLVLWRYLLERVGLDIDGDVAVVEAGTHGDLVEGVLSGAMDAALIIPPRAFDAVRRGARVLLEGPDLDLPYQLGGLVASRRYVTAAPDTARAAVEAYVAGVRAVKSRAGLAEAIIRDHGRVSDPETIRLTADFFRRAMSDPPYPSREGIAVVLDSLAGQLPQAHEWSPDDHIMDELVRQVAR